MSKRDHRTKRQCSSAIEQTLQYELSLVKERLPRIQRIRDGSIKPIRCGTCEYCRSTKRCTSIKTHFELDPEFRQREEEYDELWSPRTAQVDVQETPAV